MGLEEEIVEREEQFSVYGLALIPLLAGITKFTNPELWMGYHIQSLMPVKETLVIYGSGAVETLAGLALVSRKRTDIVASVVGIWLLAITLQVSYKGLWLIALRDLGLAVFAFSVALENFEV